MNWRELIRNKKLLAGIGVAGLLGLIVLVRRRGMPGVDVAGQETSGGRIGNPAYLDTTGTDVAGFLSQYSAGLQTQLDEYGRQLTDALEGIGTIPTSPTQPPPGKPVVGRPVPTPPAKPAPARPVTSYVTVGRFTSRNPPWNSTLSGIAGHYKTSVAALLRLNPTIRNPNLIHPGQRVRVR